MVKIKKHPTINFHLIHRIGTSIKYVRFITLISLLTAEITAQEIYPPTCKPLVISQERLEIPEGKPRMIMIHNILATDVWLVSPDNAGQTKISPERWSALAIDKTAQSISCVESRPGHEQQVSCAEALGVCEWATTSQPKETSGTFWAAENMALASISAYIARIGFTLPEKA